MIHAKLSSMNQTEKEKGKGYRASFKLRIKGIIFLSAILVMLSSCVTERTVVTRKNRSDYDFSEKAMEYLSTIGNEFPNRSVSEDRTDDVEGFRSWLEEELVRCGYDPSRIEEQSFSGKNLDDVMVDGRNIILTVPGRCPEQIIVGAHYDGSGLGDNGSGVALVLATAVGLVDIVPQCTIRYIFFDHEEDGRLGSRYYAESMSEEEMASTVFMINCDSLVFGDFCNVYGGIYGDGYDVGYFFPIINGDDVPEYEVEHTEGYDYAVEVAEKLGIEVFRTEDLDGYYEENGHGMELNDNALFTNPWTKAHPAPKNMEYIPPSPVTFGIADQAPFAVRGIPYIYFEATNWWVGDTEDPDAFLGYYETYDTSIGDGGMFMNTEYDTLENLNRYFPGRAERHYRLYSPLLSALLLSRPALSGR